MAEIKENQVAVDKTQLTLLLEKNETQAAEIKALYDGTIKMFTVLGLADGKRIKTEAFGEDGNAMSCLIKGGGSIITLAAKAASLGPFGKKAEKELKEKFSFFADLVPMFEKYGKQFNP